MVSAKFTELYNETGTIKSGPTQAELLDLYAFAKIAQKTDIEATPKPGLFDIKGKTKRGQWQKYIDEGLTPEDAEKKYIALAEKLIATHKA